MNAKQQELLDAAKELDLFYSMGGRYCTSCEAPFPTHRSFFADGNPCRMERFTKAILALSPEHANTKLRLTNS